MYVVDVAASPLGLGDAGEGASPSPTAMEHPSWCSMCWLLTHGNQVPIPRVTASVRFCTGLEDLELFFAFLFHNGLSYHKSDGTNTRAGQIKTYQVDDVERQNVELDEKCVRHSFSPASVEDCFQYNCCLRPGR